MKEDIEAKAKLSGYLEVKIVVNFFSFFSYDFTFLAKKHFAWRSYVLPSSVFPSLTHFVIIAYKYFIFMHCFMYVGSLNITLPQAKKHVCQHFLTSRKAHKHLQDFYQSPINFSLLFFIENLLVLKKLILFILTISLLLW